jgi:predicted unusual protein kinase regulating ubiquinone biosynthesis (AarF/ABC1/UbiB family)
MRSRSRRILRFAARYLVQAWWYELFLPRIGLARFSARGRAARLTRLAQHFHRLAVELGGLMIKVGQFMSSRLDVLPPEITSELAGLQDEVPAVPFAAIRALAEAELGLPLERAFSFVDPQPIASASLGQAYRARLSEMDAEQTGLLDVVIKIQRPGIEEVVDVDLRSLRRIAGWVSRVRLVSDRVDAPALLEEFATTSLEEIDYLHEAASAERFADVFANDPRVRVPEIAWERTTRRVLTLEDVTAIKINDVEALRAAGIDPAKVAVEFAAVMFDQLFVHGFFHADPHPGNIFVTPRAGGWHFAFVDFGMMGEVPPTLRPGMRHLLIAAATRDGKRMVDSFREVGVLLPSADTAELERAMTKVFARFGGVSVTELRDVDPREFREFANEFGDLVRSLPFQFPEEFLLIVRAMALTSGMCSALDHDFNIWDAVEPYSAQLLRTEGGNVVMDFVQRGLSLAGVLARLPERLDVLTTRLEEGNVSVQNPRLERRIAALERTGRRLVSAVLFGVLLIGGILVRDEPYGIWLMIGSGLPLLHAVFAGVFGRPRSSRER